MKNLCKVYRDQFIIYLLPYYAESNRTRIILFNTILDNIELIRDESSNMDDILDALGESLTGYISNKKLIELVSKVSIELDTKIIFNVNNRGFIIDLIGNCSNKSDIDITISAIRILSGKYISQLVLCN